MLGALRNCAGALSDLIEVGVSGPFGSGGPVATSTREAEIGKSPLKEAEVAETHSAPEVPESKEPEPPVKKEKKVKAAVKDKKKPKRKEKPAKARSRSRSRKAERSPESGERDRRGRGQPLRATDSRTAHLEDRRRSPSGRREEREGRRHEDRRRSEDLDSEVRRDPSRFGLNHVPIRGSAGRHQYGPPIPAGTRRPAEPAGSPPRTRPREQGSLPERGHRSYRPQESKAKKWRGYSHYQRGVDYWKRRKRSGR